jgi:sporulation protein YlmC with PRC-barrel domain
MRPRSQLFGVTLLGLAAAYPSIALAANAPEGQFISSATAGDWRASKLVGVSIYGPNDESIGKVDEVIVDASGATKAVVIGVGGFLGMGKKDVALPFSQVKWSDKPVPPKTPPPSAGMAGGAAAPAGTSPAPAMSPGAMASASSPTIYDYPDHGTVGMTKDQLKAAPDFHYASEQK